MRGYLAIDKSLPRRQIQLGFLPPARCLKKKTRWYLYLGEILTGAFGSIMGNLASIKTDVAVKENLQQMVPFFILIVCLCNTGLLLWLWCCDNTKTR